MSSHQTTIEMDGQEIKTLEDILPEVPGLRVLFVAKTPAPVSVCAGHYFQGRQGRMFWNRLREYGVYEPPIGDFEDDHLLAHGFGITDIVKVPRSYGNEPSREEYQAGLRRILDLIEFHSPMVAVFVYKKVLDQIVRFAFGRRQKSVYGFNDDLEDLFNSKVFVFPMPGTPCTSEQATVAMEQLRCTIKPILDEQ